METVKAARYLLDRQPFSELLPYLAYDETNNLFLLDHGVGLVFECSPLPFAGADTAAVLRGLFESAFPTDTSIQFMLYASPTLGPIAEEYVAIRERVHGDSIYTHFAKQRYEFLRRGTTENLFKGFYLKLRDFRLIVSLIIPCQHTPGGYESASRTAVRCSQTMRQIFNTIHLSPKAMNAEQFVNLMSEILNPSHRTDTVLHYDPSLSLKDQIIYSDSTLSVEKDHLVMDGKYCKSYTVRQFPEQWDMSNSMNFCGDLFKNARQIGVPFILTLNCHYVDINKVTTSVKRKGMTASYQAIGPMGSLFPRLAAKKRHFDTFAMSLENGETPMYAYLNLFTFADSSQQMDDISGACQSLYRSMGMILQEDTYIMLPLFMQTLPMGYLAATQRDLRRQRTLTTSNVAELANITADWSGLGLPVFQLVGRRGQAQFFDIFSNPTGGYSGVVVASTGAGKSFFVNDLTVSYLGVGARIWTLDAGRSYQKLCQTIGGDFIEFSKDVCICINPFSQIKDIDEEMPMLKNIVAQMASREKLDDLSLSYIEEAIKDIYLAKGTAMTVTDIAKYLGGKQDPRQRDLAQRIYPYTASGAYACFFEGVCTLSPKANYVVLELEELRSKKDLQEVVLLTLLYQIQQQIISDRSLYKLVIIDEAWDLLSGGNTTGFIEAGYRRFRKYKGACLSITQGINDFYKVPSGEAIIENSDFFFLLRQRPESIEALKKSQRVSLSEGLYDVLKSVHTDIGNYSEIFVYTPVGLTVGRLVVDRFTQLLYTTKPDEVARIQSHVDKGLSSLDAIKQVMADEAVAK